MPRDGCRAEIEAGLESEGEDAGRLGAKVALGRRIVVDGVHVDCEDDGPHRGADQEELEGAALGEANGLRSPVAANMRCGGWGRNAVVSAGVMSLQVQTVPAICLRWRT